MDLSQIVKVYETTQDFEVNAYLQTGRWTILCTAPGKTFEGEAYTLYSLGWYGPIDPEHPELDNTEHPDVPRPDLPPLL